MPGAVCGGGLTHRLVLDCPTCQQRRRFVGLWAAYYGDSVTCLACGDTWTDGEMHPRPFRPRWRQDATRRARQRWLTALPAAEFRKAVRAEMEALVERREEWDDEGGVASPDDGPTLLVGGARRRVDDVPVAEGIL